MIVVGTESDVDALCVCVSECSWGHKGQVCSTDHLIFLQVRRVCVSNNGILGVQHRKISQDLTYPADWPGAWITWPLNGRLLTPWGFVT